MEHSSPIHEQFFDQIYEDLDPFWSMPAQEIKEIARTWKLSISIRDGVTQMRNSSIFVPYEWMRMWMGALEEIQEHLPDVDMAFNYVDEPRIMIPWEDMNARMAKSQQTKHTRTSSALKPILDEYSKYPVIEEWPEEDVYDKDFDMDTPYWYKVRATCPPDSPGRKAEYDKNWTAAIDFDGLLNEDPTPSPYIHNVTSSRNACLHPELRYLHGAYIEPSTHDTIGDKLIPLFSGCKVSGVHNDILIPAAEYWSNVRMYSGGQEEEHIVPWEDKIGKAIWLGSATGGNSNKTTWRHYHRHRFLATMNASHIAAAERLRFEDDISEDEKKELQGITAENIFFPTPGKYGLPAMQSKPTSFGKWTAQFVNDSSGFTNMFCSPQGMAMFSKGLTCEYMDAYFRHRESMNMTEMFKHKFLPDVDGQSYSGRYRAFLDSTSVPIKSTVYSEWHDARLVPWHHYIPLDVTYKDWWTIMDFFGGYDEEQILGIGDGKEAKKLHREPHDEEAKAIAYAGLEWSQKALRREDMLVYTYRLILEYARICDENRLDMGWTGDL